MPELQTDEAVEKARDDSVFIVKKSLASTLVIAQMAIFLALFLVKYLKLKELDMSYVSRAWGALSIFGFVKYCNTKDGKLLASSIGGALFYLFYLVIDLFEIIF